MPSRAGWGRGSLPGRAAQGGAGHLHAVVVGALPVEVAAVVVDAAVVQRAEAHEAVLQRVVPLLVHVVVPDHILLAGEPLPGQGRLAGAWPARWPTAPGQLLAPGPRVSLSITLLGVEAADCPSQGQHTRPWREQFQRFQKHRLPLTCPQAPNSHAPEQRGQIGPSL